MVVEPMAMHMSDGIVNAPTSVMFGLCALAAIALCMRRASRELDERTVPLAGLVAAFIFAMQMVNFPILPGASGHLLGGTLAAVLVGPYTGALCVTIVLVVQALLFADGGVSALGLNITNMAVISVVIGYTTALLLYAAVRRLRREVRTPALGGLVFVAALSATVCAATGFLVEYAIGGASSVSVGAVAGYMVGTHVLIGLGEGVITALTVVAIARARPDLVYLLRGSRLEAGAPA